MKKIWHRSPAGKGFSDDCFTISISDLMAGLLGIFILVLVVVVLRYTAETDLLRGNESNRKRILENLQAEILNNYKGAKKADISIDEGQGILRLGGDFLFELNKADLKADGQKFIPVLTSAFITVLSKEENKNTVDAIFIEGHTDRNSGPTLDHNWRLSAQRAINTRTSMHKYNANLDRILTNDKGQALFSCSAYGDSRLIDNRVNNKDADAINRRINFRIIMNTSNASFNQVNRDVNRTYTSGKENAAEPNRP